MDIILKDITNAAGELTTGLTPTIVKFVYKDGTAIAPPVVNEIGTDGIYLATDVTINRTAYLVINAGINGVDGTPYYHYQLEKGLVVRNEYIFVDNKLKLQSVLMEDGTPLELNSCISTIYDAADNVIDTQTGVNNGSFYYNTQFAADLVPNDNSRVEVVCTYQTVPFNNVLLIPTQIIRL